MKLVLELKLSCVKKIGACYAMLQLGNESQIKSCYTTFMLRVSLHFSLFNNWSWNPQFYVKPQRNIPHGPDLSTHYPVRRLVFVEVLIEK